MIYFYFAQHEFFFFLVYTLINPLIDERRKKMDNYLNEILFELNHFFFSWNDAPRSRSIYIHLFIKFICNIRHSLKISVGRGGGGASVSRSNIYIYLYVYSDLSYTSR